MSYRMGDLRNLDLNLYNFVTSGLNNDGYTVLSGYDQTHVASGIYILDGFPEDWTNVKVPSIAIEHLNSREEPFQLGSGKTDVRRFSIDVFTRTDGERDDLGERVKNYFDNSMNVFDYNLLITGGNYVRLGIADFDNKVMFPVRGSQLKATKFRMQISLDISVSINNGSSLTNP